MSKKIEIVDVNNRYPNVEYAIRGIEEYFCINGVCSSDSAGAGERALTFSFLKDSLRKLLGKTLTVIDASIMDEKQNKAIKDLIKNIFSEELEFAIGFAFDTELTNKIADESFEALSEEEKQRVLNNAVDIEEVLSA